jgi:hypothetical protein
MSEYLVHVGRTAKVVKAIGRFALFEIDAFANLLVTSDFILSLNDDQFWSIQCKLEAKKRNVWFFMSKDGLTECEGQSAEDIQRIYLSYINNDCLEEIERTNLYLGGTELYIHNNEYIGILRRQLEMIDYQPVIKKVADRIKLVVDTVHIFTPVENKTLCNDYLRKLQNGSEEQET